MTPTSNLPWSTGSINKTVADAGGEYVAETASVGDAVYIAHAANAYPKLVEALRLAMRGLDPQDNANQGSVTDNLRALLRELGETE